MQRLACQWNHPRLGGCKDGSGSRMEMLLEIAAVRRSDESCCRAAQATPRLLRSGSTQLSCVAVFQQRFSLCQRWLWLIFRWAWWTGQTQRLLRRSFASFVRCLRGPAHRHRKDYRQSWCLHTSRCKPICSHPTCLKELPSLLAFEVQITRETCQSAWQWQCASWAFPAWHSPEKSEGEMRCVSCLFSRQAAQLKFVERRSRTWLAKHCLGEFGNNLYVETSVRLPFFFHSGYTIPPLYARGARACNAILRKRGESMPLLCSLMWGRPLTHSYVNGLLASTDWMVQSRKCWAAC